MEAENLLKAAGVPYRLLRLKARAMTVEEVIKFSEESLKSEIAKTIVLRGEEKQLAVLMVGKDRLDWAKVKKQAGEKLSPVPFEEVATAAGSEPGAVCPLLLKIPLWVDKKIFQFEKINFGSGNHLFGLEMETADLQKVVKFEIVDVAKD